MDASALNALSALVRIPLAAFGIGFARMFGLLLILPMSTRLGLRGLQRAGVAAALSCLIVPALVPQLDAQAFDTARLVLLIAKEACIGFMLGLLFAAPFWAAESAGEILDIQRGSRGALAPDPVSEEQGGITATLLVLTTIAIFLASDGMHLLINAMLQSYRVWPALDLAPHFAPSAALQLLSLLDDVLRAGLLLAAPILGAMLLTELTLALISRFAPQLNVFDLALSVKGLVFVIGLPLYAVFLIGYLRAGLAPLLDLDAAFRRLAGN
jgi:type III secretion protein T